MSFSVSLFIIVHLHMSHVISEKESPMLLFEMKELNKRFDEIKCWFLDIWRKRSFSRCWPTCLQCSALRKLKPRRDVGTDWSGREFFAPPFYSAQPPSCSGLCYRRPKPFFRKIKCLINVIIGFRFWGLLVICLAKPPWNFLQWVKPP